MNFLAYFFFIACTSFARTKCQPVNEDTIPAKEDYNGIFSDSIDEEFANLGLNEVGGQYLSKEFIQFDLSFLNTLCTKHQDRNVVASSASMKSLLALLTKVYAQEKLEGIKNTTQKESQSINYLLDLQTLVQNNRTTITIDSKNKIYRANDVHISDMAADSSEIEAIDFTSPTAADTINKWVNESTRGLISSVVERSQLSELTRLVLLNSIYLKAKWDSPFSPTQTIEGCFNSPNAKCRRVKYMQMRRRIKYANFRERNTVMFELSFADPRYAVVFVMPYGNVTVYDVLAGLQNLDMFKLFGSMSEEIIHLMLPRTTIEFSDSNLVEILTKRNVRSFFGSNPKLDALLKEDVLSEVNTVFHRAKIILNEEGAEAAAVSGGLEFRSVLQEFTVKVDCPFLFFLRDVDTGLILFEGLVNSPDEAN